MGEEGQQVMRCTMYTCDRGNTQFYCLFVIITTKHKIIIIIILCLKKESLRIHSHVLWFVLSSHVPQLFVPVLCQISAFHRDGGVGAAVCRVNIV